MTVCSAQNRCARRLIVSIITIAQGAYRAAYRRKGDWRKRAAQLQKRKFPPEEFAHK
jgi:hypothetical protein